MISSPVNRNASWISYAEIAERSCWLRERPFDVMSTYLFFYQAAIDLSQLDDSVGSSIRRCVNSTTFHLLASVGLWVSRSHDLGFRGARLRAGIECGIE